MLAQADFTPDQQSQALTFDNRFLRALPVDSQLNPQPHPVSQACYSWVTPRKASKPRLLAYSHPLAKTLALSSDVIESRAFVEAMAGNRLLPGSSPYAMCYSGHQFGVWAGQLGDGRAINLGEMVTASGDYWTLQLKGAGPTPYSRSADGLAVLRSSLREFVCSEAMYHLGIPTTRALTLVSTGDQVLRDMFYDGHPKREPGAIVCRAAPTFIRFGSFEHHAARDEQTLLKKLADFTIAHYFPELDLNDPSVYGQWFKRICQLTAELVVHWQRVGFVHGVLNTDNMSIIGQTIDYGPYGWLDVYDPNWTPNTTDKTGRRYRFGRQPEIGYWNLGPLANALYPLIGDSEPFYAGLDAYQQAFNQGWENMMAEKLGLSGYPHNLTDALLTLLTEEETDYCLFFRYLADSLAAPSVEQAWSILQPAFYGPQQRPASLTQRWRDWLAQYRQTGKNEPQSSEQRQAAMNRVNPLYLPRNYLTQQAIDQAEQGNLDELDALMRVIQSPYQPQPGCRRYAEKRPDWARDKAGCAMLSCSS